MVLSNGSMLGAVPCIYFHVETECLQEMKMPPLPECCGERRTRYYGESRGHLQFASDRDIWCSQQHSSIFMRRELTIPSGLQEISSGPQHVFHCISWNENGWVILTRQDWKTADFLYLRLAREYSDKESVSRGKMYKGKHCITILEMGHSSNYVWYFMRSTWDRQHLHRVLFSMAGMARRSPVNRKVCAASDLGRSDESFQCRALPFPMNQSFCSSSPQF